MKKLILVLPVIVFLAASCNQSKSTPGQPINNNTTDQRQNEGSPSPTNPPQEEKYAFKDLSILYPAGREEWTSGNSYEIRWKTSNIAVAAKVRITLEYSVSATGSPEPIVRETTNTGSYSLQLPQGMKPGLYWLSAFEIKEDGSEGAGGTANDYVTVK